jgi:hypothetical protein
MGTEAPTISRRKIGAFECCYCRNGCSRNRDEMVADTRPPNCCVCVLDSQGPQVLGKSMAILRSGGLMTSTYFPFLPVCLCTNTCADCESCSIPVLRVTLMSQNSVKRDRCISRR